MKSSSSTKSPHQMALRNQHGGSNNKPNYKDAAHEPECSHVKHFFKMHCLNSLVHFSPGTVPVHCRLWNVGGGGAQSVDCEESGVLSAECSV